MNFLKSNNQTTKLSWYVKCWLCGIFDKMQNSNKRKKKHNIKTKSNWITQILQGHNKIQHFDSATFQRDCIETNTLILTPAYIHTHPRNTPTRYNICFCLSHFLSLFLPLKQESLICSINIPIYRSIHHYSCFRLSLSHTHTYTHLVWFNLIIYLLCLKKTKKN